MKKGLNKTLALTLVTLGAVAVFSLPIPKPPSAGAQGFDIGIGYGGEAPYGGPHAYLTECTCTPPSEWHFVYDYASLTPLFLVYTPGISKLYEYYDLFGSYFLGSYRPGAGVCKIYVGEDCIDLYTDGLMGSTPGTGTSL